MEKFLQEIKSLIEKWEITYNPPQPTIPVPEAKPIISTSSIIDPVQPIKMTQTKIQQWGTATAHWEGHFDGNLKYSTLTASWGAIKGRPALDGGFFCEWKDEATGFQALCNFLQLGAENQLLEFHESRLFSQFMKTFAGNPPQTYIQGIADMIPCQLDTPVATFLS